MGIYPCTVKNRTGVFRILLLVSLICSLTLPTAATANEPCHDYGTPYEGTQYSMGYVGILCGQQNLNDMDQVIAQYPAIYDAAQQNSGDSGNSSNEPCFDYGTPYGGQVETLGYIGLVCGQENITWMDQLIINYFNEWNDSQQNGGSENPSGQTCHDFGTPFDGMPYSRGYIGVICGQENITWMEQDNSAHQSAWYAAQQNGIGNENSNVYTPSTTTPLMPPNSSVSSGTILGQIQEKIESGVQTPKTGTKLPEKKVETKKPVTSAKKSITCKKGKKTQIIKGKNPKCPSGFRKIA
jgi:hypothetical protein